jgi:hypothetical protein
MSRENPNVNVDDRAALRLRLQSWRRRTSPLKRDTNPILGLPHHPTNPIFLLSIDHEIKCRRDRHRARNLEASSSHRKIPDRAIDDRGAVIKNDLPGLECP